MRAEALLKRYLEWLGTGSVYVELNRNFLQGDAGRNRTLAMVARETGVPLVATNDVHYHIPERYRLQNAMVAARLNTTMDRALPHLLPNLHLHLKSPAEMERLFNECPEAVRQHPPHRGTVRLRPQQRPRLHPARSRRTGRVHG